MNKILLGLVLVSAFTVSAEELTGMRILNLCRVDSIQEACDYKDIQNDLTEAEVKCGLIGKVTNSSDCKEADKLKKKKTEALKALLEVLGE